MENEWNRPSNETLSSTSICRGGRRKQSKPVKMLRKSDGDELETVGRVDDFSMLLEFNEEVKEEERGSFTRQKIHKLGSLRDISVLPSENNYTELTRSFLKGSRVTCPTRTGRKLDDDCLDLGKSGAPPGKEVTYRVRDWEDTCDGFEFETWNVDGMDTMVIGPSWSSKPGSAIDGVSNFLEETCLNGDRSRMTSRKEKRNVVEGPKTEQKEITGTHIMEVVGRTSRATDNKAKATETTPSNEQSETITFATMNKKYCKTSLASNRKRNGIVLKECRMSMMISDKQNSRTVELSNREPNETLEISSRGPGKTMEIWDRQDIKTLEIVNGEDTKTMKMSNREDVNTMEISNRENNKTIEISNRENTKTMKMSNREDVKTMEISNRENNKTMEISNREVKDTSMILDKDTSKRKENSDEHPIKTEHIIPSGDCFPSNTANNLSSQKSETFPDFNGVTSDTLTHSGVYSVLDKLHHTSNVFQSTAAREPRSAGTDDCRTSMRQCVAEDYCSICQKRFCNKYYLKKHRQDVHGLVRSAAEVARMARGPNNAGTDDNAIQALRFGTDSPAGCSGSLFSSEGVNLDNTLESDERTSFASSSTSTPLLNYLVFSSTDDVPPKRTLPAAVHGSQHYERFIFGSSEANRSDLCQSHFANSLSLITDGLQAGPGLGFLDAYLRLCRDIGGSFNGKSEWEQDVYKRDSAAALSRSLADFQTNAFVKFQDDYMAIAKARKVAEQCAAMDRSDASYGGIFPLVGKRSFDCLSSSFPGKDDGCASDVMSKLLKAERFLIGGAESAKTVSRFAAGKVSDRVVCDLCGKEVCNKYFLKTHKTRVHGWQEGTPSQPSDRSMGLGPFSSTLSYLVDGISSSKHIAGSHLATKPHPRRQPADGTQSTKSSCKDPRTKDSANGFCTPGITRTIDCQSTLKSSPYLPFWHKASPSSAISTLEEAGRSQSLLNQGMSKEFGVMTRTSCRLCNKVVSNKHFLRTHMKRRHGIGGCKVAESSRNFMSSIESVNSTSAMYPQTKEPKASKSFSLHMCANHLMNEEAENFLNCEDAGSEVVVERFTKQTPDKNGVIGTRDEEREKSTTEDDLFSVIPVRRDSVTKTHTGNSADPEELHSSKISDDATDNEDRETPINRATTDYRSERQRDSVVRKRERCESGRRSSPEADRPSVNAHVLDSKSHPLGSSGGQNSMFRIRCSICRKRFRSSAHFKIHVRKIHASVLPNPSDCCEIARYGKPETDDRRREPKTRGKQRMTAGVGLTIFDDGGYSNCEASSPRVESPAAGVDRRVGERTSMQPFLLREVAGLDLFCPSVVYLPSLRAITNPTSVTFTLTPVIQEELGQSL